MKIKRVWVSVLAGLTLLVAGIINKPATTKAESLKYNVAAILPENQMPGSKVTYFDLLVKPNAKQTLQVRINNQDDQAHDYHVSVNRAGTNRNGVIDYSKYGQKIDASAKYNLEKLVSKPSKVNVPAQTSKVVDIELTSPKKTFDGVILGGVRIAQVPAKASDTSKGVSITNQFAYVIGLQLHSSDKQVAPEMKLLKVTPKQLNYRNYITATLQNNQPTIMRDVAVDTYVTKQGESKKYVAMKKENMALAPNSHFALPIGDEGYQLEAGKYTLHLKATADAKKYKWAFTKDFEISRETANKLNDTSVDKPEKSGPNIWLIIIGVIIILLLIILIILLLKRKKDGGQADAAAKKQVKK